MPKMESIIKAEIMRLAQRQVRMAFLPLKSEVRRMKLKLSSISDVVGSLNRAAKQLGLEETEPNMEAGPEEVKAARLTPERIRGLRRKLGISQRELGILSGATLGAVQSWEKGKFKPKADKKAVLVALRKLGKWEVRKLLAEKVPKEKPKEPVKLTRKAVPKKVVRKAKPSGRKLSPKSRNLPVLKSGRSRWQGKNFPKR